MPRWFTRSMILLLAGAAGIAIARSSRRRRPAGARPGSSAAWPPFEPSPAPDPATPVEAVPDWVAPVDGGCPQGYPIKATASSRIYHVPGGRFYDRTVPQRCYAAAETAERDGYRRAKA